MLGPARFTHITDCARAVCTAMSDQERENERKAKAADLVAQLREWDTEVTELKLEIAALEPKKTSTEGEEKGEKPSDTGKHHLFTWRALFTFAQTKSQLYQYPSSLPIIQTS